MIIKVFPSSLPRLKDFSLSPIDGRAQTAAKTLPLALRRRTSSRASKLSVSWRLTDAQYEIFESFFRQDLLDGNRWFLLPTPLSGADCSVVRFVDAFDASKLGYDGYDVSADLVTSDRRWFVPPLIVDEFTENFEEGLAPYSVVAGLGSLFTIDPASYSGNGLQGASQSFGPISTIRRSISSFALGSLEFYFKLGTKNSDDAVGLAIRNTSGTESISIQPCREASFDSARRFLLGITKAGWGVNSYIGTVASNVWHKFFFFYNSEDQNAYVEIRNAATDDLVHSLNLPGPYTEAPVTPTLLEFGIDSSGVTTATAYDQITLRGVGPLDYP